MKWLSVFVCLYAFTSISSAQVLDRIIAVVNDEIILASDEAELLKRLKQPGSIDDILLLGQSQDDLSKDQKKRMDYLVLEKLFESEIKRLNLSVTIERVEQEIRDIARRNGISRNEMLSALRAQGVSTSEYQDFVKTKIERQSLIEAEIASKIRISDEEVLGHYLRNNPNNESTVYEYQLAHIFFNPRKGGPQAALQRAEQVYAKAQSGEAFDKLAEQNSEDSNFTAGGLLGNFKAGEMSKEFEQAVHNLGIGQISKPVSSRAGIHILRVLNKKVVADPRFEQQKERLRATLAEQAFKRHLENWIQVKRDDSFIRINQ